MVTRAYKLAWSLLVSIDVCAMDFPLIGVSVVILSMVSVITFATINATDWSVLIASFLKSTFLNIYKLYVEAGFSQIQSHEFIIATTSYRQLNHSTHFTPSTSPSLKMSRLFNPEYFNPNQCNFTISMYYARRIILCRSRDHVNSS